MARVLGVGIATLDIVNVVDGYPAEDSEVRALHQRVACGGNAANLLLVLSQLGHRCAWAGTLADEPDARRIVEDLERNGIDRGPVRVAGGKVPTSYVTVNRRNGSRTIVHYRDLPEYTADDFARLELGAFDWLHFEGRNVAETLRMLERARAEHPGIPRSVEIEKPREGIDALLPFADVVLLSRAFARARGLEEPERFLAAMREQAPAAKLVCAWGEEGAHALGHDGRRYASPAFPPPRVVDTLGAGDTFNAGVLDALLRGEHLSTALVAGCRLAGRKLSQHGLDRLGVS